MNDGYFEVRPARAADAQGIWALLEELSWPAMSAWPAPAVRYRTLEQILDSDWRHVLVACDARQLLGTTELRLFSSLSHGISTQALVENVIVTESARGRGVGRALMNRAEQIARDAGAYKIDLVSAMRRPEAHGMYETMGYAVPVRGFRKSL